MIDKELLLSLNLVEDCEALSDYCQLINKNENTPKQKYCTNKHHIIPRSYYKENNLPINNSQQNTVNLTYSDHFLAHYYLSLCSKGRYKYYNELAVTYIVSKYNLSVSTILNDPTTYQKLREDLSLKKSLARKGKPNPHNAEWTAKLRAAAKARKGIPTNRTPWNKGKIGAVHRTEETKEKIRQAVMRRPPLSLEKRVRLRQVNLGNRHKLGWKTPPEVRLLQGQNQKSCQPVLCEETGEIFYSIGACARHLQKPYQTVLKMIKNHTPLKGRILTRWSAEKKNIHLKYLNCHFVLIKNKEGK